MPGRDVTYPFSAVAGNGAGKKALMCLLADGDICGVLVTGPAGTAKSILARSVSCIDGRDIVELPAGAGEEEIFGGADIEAALRTGKTCLRKGVLARADGNILLIDGANLMDPALLGAVMECVSSRWVKLEREGISTGYPLHTSVIATADPAEKDIPQWISDRFEACIASDPASDAASRGDIAGRHLDYSRDPEAFRREYAGADQEAAARVEAARELIPRVRITRRDIQDACSVCAALGASGHRGDIAAVRLARDLAALDGRESISAEDIREAAVMALLHRRAGGQRDSGAGEPDAESEETEKKEWREEAVCGGGIAEASEAAGILSRIPDASAPAEEPGNTGMPILQEVEKDLSDLDRRAEISLESIIGRTPRDSGKNGRKGRKSGFRIPRGETEDPAIIPTIRAAAPYQRFRKPNGLKAVIEPQDIRENIRTKQSRCSFMFAMDVSGSLVSTGMLDEAARAVRAMLEDGYVRRDKVGLLTFGQKSIDLAVPFTRNVEAVFDALGKAVCGGSTPLGGALLELRRYVSGYVLRNPGERCYIILITDGKSETPVVEGYEPVHELWRIAAGMDIPGAEWIVIDNGDAYRKVDYAGKLASALGARRIMIGDILSGDSSAFSRRRKSL